MKIKCDGIAFYSPKTIMLFAPIIISKTKKFEANFYAMAKKNMVNVLRKIMDI